MKHDSKAENEADCEGKMNERSEVFEFWDNFLFLYLFFFIIYFCTLFSLERKWRNNNR